MPRFKGLTRPCADLAQVSRPTPPRWAEIRHPREVALSRRGGLSVVLASNAVWATRKSVSGVRLASPAIPPTDGRRCPTS